MLYDLIAKLDLEPLFNLFRGHWSKFRVGLNNVELASLNNVNNIVQPW